MVESSEKLPYLINGIICIFFITAFYIIFKNLITSLWVVGIAVSALKICTLYKIKHLHQPLYFSDFILIPYFLVSPSLLKLYWVDVLFGLTFITAFLLTVFFNLKKNKFMNKKRILISFLCSLIYIFIGIWIFKEKTVLRFGLDQKKGNQKILASYGPLVTFLDSLIDFNLVISKDLLPKGSSPSYFLQSVTLPHGNAEGLPSKRPDIFVILNESTFDPSIVNASMNSGEDVNFFKKSKFLFAHRPLRVQTFGGKTYKSEFSFLTGINTYDLPNSGDSAPFSVVPLVRESIASVFRDNGYYTVGIYPVEGSFFNARKAYHYYNFDEFIDAKDLNLSNWINSDTYLFNKIFFQVDRLRRKTTKPLFVFMLTMNNHGPHDRTVAKNLFPKEKSKWTLPFSDYLYRFKDTENAHRSFIERYLGNNHSRPGILLAFGDHLPSFEGETEKMPFLKEVDSPLYQTFFSLWSNTPLSGDLLKDKKVDIFFLGGLILDLLNLNKSEYFKANSALRQLCHSSLDKCEPGLYESYQNYIYQHLDIIH